MANPIVYGPGYSTYARTVRLALEEKGVPYDFVEVDFLQGMPEEHLARHPFGKVPAFEHDGYKLYETPAICRYVDDAFDGQALQPGDAKGRARMTQIICALDSYGYRPMIHDVLIQRAVVPTMGGESDETVIAEGLKKAETCLNVCEGFLGDSSYMVGDSLSLADLHLVPILTYFKLAPDSAPVLDKVPGLMRWYASMRTRPSVDVYCPEELKSP